MLHLAISAQLASQVKAGSPTEAEEESESQEHYDLVEINTTEAIVSDGSISGIGKKRKPSDPSDSDSGELPILIVTLIVRLRLDSASDYVAKETSP